MSFRADKLASWAQVSVRIVIEFYCERCRAEFSAETTSAYSAARIAWGRGWRTNDEDEPRCPDCVGK